MTLSTGCTVRRSRSVVQRRRAANGQTAKQQNDQNRDPRNPYQKKAQTGRPTRTISKPVKGTKENSSQPGNHKKAPSSAEISASTPAPQQSVDCQYTIPDAHTEISCRMRVRKNSTAGAKPSTRNRLAGWRRKKGQVEPHKKQRPHGPQSRQQDVRPARQPQSTPTPVRVWDRM